MCEARIEELLVEIRERRLRNLAFAIGRSKTFAGTEYSITQDRTGAGRRSRDGFAAPRRETTRARALRRDRIAGVTFRQAACGRPVPESRAVRATVAEVYFVNRCKYLVHVV
jgi:hypothetical protein